MNELVKFQRQNVLTIILDMVAKQLLHIRDKFPSGFGSLPKRREP